jgi:hypothetical protein
MFTRSRNREREEQAWLVVAGLLLFPQRKVTRSPNLLNDGNRFERVLLELDIFSEKFIVY